MKYMYMYNGFPHVPPGLCDMKLQLLIKCISFVGGWGGMEGKQLSANKLSDRFFWEVFFTFTVICVGIITIIRNIRFEEVHCYLLMEVQFCYQYGKVSMN